MAVRASKADLLANGVADDTFDVFILRVVGADRFLDRDDTTAGAGGVSADPDNLLTVGGDGLPFLAPSLFMALDVAP